MKNNNILLIEDDPIKISFPINTYKRYYNNEYITLNKFNFDAMILICANRICFDLIFCKLFNIKKNSKYNFHYFLYEFEIRYLSLLKEKDFLDIIKQNSFIIDFNFNIDPYKTHIISGKIELNTQFINNCTLEKSYFKIFFRIVLDSSDNILPYFLKYNAFISYLTNFNKQIFISIFNKIHNININTNRISCNNFNELEYIYIPENINIENTRKLISDFTLDIFLIILNIFDSEKSSDGLLYINTDDILQFLGKQKNKNSKNNYGGYKNHQREKVHKSLFLLNVLNFLIIREYKKYSYFINIPANKYKLRKLKGLTSELLKLNPVKNLWIKRFAFKLVYDNFSSNIIKVSNLLSSIEKEYYDSFKPGLIREKFEYTLDSLIKLKVIRNWEYKKINENNLEIKNWYIKWINLKIVYKI